MKLPFTALAIALAFGMMLTTLTPAAAQGQAAKSEKKKGCFNTEQCIKSRSTQKGLSPRQAASSCERDAAAHGNPCR